MWQIIYIDIYICIYRSVLPDTFTLNSIDSSLYIDLYLTQIIAKDLVLVNNICLIGEQILLVSESFFVYNNTYGIIISWYDFLLNQMMEHWTQGWIPRLKSQDFKPF